MKRTTRRSRPQLVCVLADNSGSMAGPKAQAATEGIQEMLLECQATGPRGADRSYFRLVLIRFGSKAELEPQCNMTPVRQIDAASITIRGDGGGTNITEALDLAYRGLEQYMREVVEPHPERTEHPLPLVLLFSDGHNGFGNPEPIAARIKQLNVDGDPITIACAGVSTDDADRPDEELLKRIASAECYLDIDDAQVLSAFLAEAGSSGVSSPAEVAEVIHQIKDRRGIED